MIPTVCDKERLVMIVQTQTTNLLSDKTNFQNKIPTKGQNNYTKQQIRRIKKFILGFFLHTEICPKIHTKLSYSQTKQREGWIHCWTSIWLD